MDKFEDLKKSLGEYKVLENEPLSKHTYFKIGGPARLIYEAKTEEELQHALNSTRRFGVDFVVLGGGANVLVSNQGFEGLVIINRVSGVKLIGIKGTIGKTGKGVKSALVWASSGTLMNQVGRFSIDQGLEGLEFLLSVPGTVGGGIKINAHYEVEKGEFIGNKLTSAVLYNPKDGKIRTKETQYFNFDYDYSKIQETGEIVLEAVFKLEMSDDPIALMANSIENVKRRNEEQPIGIACSGCVFRNISHQDALRLSTPNLTTSTGYIIDSLGLKGLKIGGAEISERHANFILNTNNATASDVLELIKLVKEKALLTYDLKLKEEIFFIGDFDNKIQISST